jgi:hypothetical protein
VDAGNKCVLLPDALLNIDILIRCIYLSLEFYIMYCFKHWLSTSDD